MPKRVIDFDAMWGSDKLAACAEWAQAEYAWLYGLADASGSFEMTNLRVIWGRVAAIRHNLSIERLAQVFDEFHDKGLLFQWEEHGKRYAHWTGSDVPGRLPPPSWRMRLEKLAPPVPKQQLAEYVSRFARGRASSPGGEFQSASLAQAPHAGLNPGFERGQAQDWNRNKKREWQEGGREGLEVERETAEPYPLFQNQTENSQDGSADAHSVADNAPSQTGNTRQIAPQQEIPAAAEPKRCAPAWEAGASAKSVAAAREARVGQGPVGCAVRVKSEVLERVRMRDESLRRSANGMRAP